MATFHYVARDESGRQVEGDISAQDEQQAARALRSEGNFVVRLGAATGSRTTSPKRTSSVGGRLFREKLRPTDVILFTNQLAVMVETGVSLSEALDSCRHDGNSPAFKGALDGVIAQVEGGSEFSAALASDPRVFPPIYVNLVRASEASGTMGPMLNRLADFLEHQRDLARRIKGALWYPIVMVVFALGVTIFMMTFVLPRFATIYAGREDSLPLPTRFLMGLSDALVEFGQFALGGVVLAAVALVVLLRQPHNRERAEALKLRLPLVGPLFHRTYLSRSLYTLGTMIQSGVSMLERVQLTAAASGSRQYRKMWETVNQRLESGLQLSESLEDQPQIPRSVNKMLSAGERSGKLGPVMERVATFAEAELNAALKTFTSMLEPAIVTFLGFVVGGLVLALLLPIFTISKAMR